MAREIADFHGVNRFKWLLQQLDAEFERYRVELSRLRGDVTNESDEIGTVQQLKAPAPAGGIATAELPEGSAEDVERECPLKLPLLDSLLAAGGANGHGHDRGSAEDVERECSLKLPIEAISNAVSQASSPADLRVPEDVCEASPASMMPSRASTPASMIPSQTSMQLQSPPDVPGTVVNCSDEHVEKTPTAGARLSVDRYQPPEILTNESGLSIPSDGDLALQQKPTSVGFDRVVQPLYEDCVPAYWRQALSEATEAIPKKEYGQYISFSQLRYRHLSGMKNYEVVVGLLIVLNAAFIGWQVQHRAVHREVSTLDIVGGTCFGTLFLFEIAYRLWYERCNFFRGPDHMWNLFDLLIVFLVVAEECLRWLFFWKIPLFQRLGVLRIMRLLRFVRILQLLRVLAAVHEFRMFVNTMLCGSRVMLWVAVVVSALAFIVGVFLTEGSYDACAGGKSGSLCHHFGTLDRGILTLFQVMFGGLVWGQVMDDLLVLHPLYPAFFAIAISFVMIILMNTITALVIEMVAEIARRPEAKMKETKDSIALLNRIFIQLDPNNSGDISISEIKHALTRDSELLKAMVAINLDISDDASTFFEMLDRDKTGVVQKSEFVFGCLRIKGEAKAVDLVRVQQSLLELRNVVCTIASKLDTMSGLMENKDIDASPTAPVRVTSWDRPGRNGSKKTATSEPTPRRMAAGVTHRFLNPMLVAYSGCRIDKTEQRAMSLKDLRNLRREIRLRCHKEQWADMTSGLLLEPEGVNLYHLNYHHISPLTSPEGVILSGMVHGTYEETQKVFQVDASSQDVLPLAEGVVQKTTTGSTIRVKITRGIFQQKTSEDRRLLVSVDNAECGEPSKVQSPNALSYKELVSSGALIPRWFCCHWWGEPVLDFVSCCEFHAKNRVMTEASYWICAYANCQHDLGADISVDPEVSSFRRAMTLSEGILLVLDPLATPFKRIWCDFELYKTIATDKKVLDIVTVHGDEPCMISEDCLPQETTYYKSLREQKFPIRLLVEGMGRNLEDGDASVDLDKKRILESIARDVPITGLGKNGMDTYQQRLTLALRRANNALHAYFALAAWSYAVNNDIVQDLKLAETLAKDEERQRLSLTLAHSEKVTDNDILILSEGLPPNLEQLALSFDGCPNITDAGLKVLGQSFPYGLRGLKLDFTSCKDVTDNGVHQLVEFLPDTIEELELCFAHCQDVSLCAAFEISTKVPPNLVHLSLTLTGTKVDRKFESAAALRKYLSRQQRLAFMGSAVGSVVHTVGRYVHRHSSTTTGTPRASMEIVPQ